MHVPTFSMPISVAPSLLFIFINCHISATGVLASFFCFARCKISPLLGRSSKISSFFSMLNTFDSKLPWNGVKNVAAEKGVLSALTVSDDTFDFKSPGLSLPESWELSCWFLSSANAALKSPSSLISLPFFSIPRWLRISRSNPWRILKFTAPSSGVPRARFSSWSSSTLIVMTSMLLSSSLLQRVTIEIVWLNSLRPPYY